MCSGKHGLGKQFTVIPSEPGNFLINRKQTAELKPVACLTEICSDKWLCILFPPLCDQKVRLILWRMGFEEKK